MIIDHIDRLKQYEAFLPHLSEAETCLIEHMHDVPGRYCFTGGFILIQEGTTVPLATADFEAHRKYLDLQILLDGAETIEWAEICRLKRTRPYDTQNDRELFSGKGCTFHISPDTFYICSPHDAHKASGHTDLPSYFRKAVVKLQIEESRDCAFLAI